MKKKYSRPTVIHRVSFFTILCVTSGCADFIKIDNPKTELVTATVYTNDVTASSAVTGIYEEMMSGTTFASGDIYSVTSLCGLSADEFQNQSTDANRIAFYTNSLLATNTVVTSALWQEMYRFIYYSNSVLVGLSASTGISDSVKRQLEGEAKFIRAFCNFYLVNLWGDVPLITSTDYRINSMASKSSSADVYDGIVADLKDAENMLSEDYSLSNNERIRPNRWAAKALLSRAYLYTGDWVNAEAEATLLINNTSLYSLESLDNIFLANSNEAIWQLMPVVPGVNTKEGRRFIITTAPTHVSLSDIFLGAFENGDNRRTSWVGSKTITGTTYYFPYKYKVRTGSTLTEYSVVLRLAEQYLIRSEALTQQGKTAAAIEDLDIIRLRAGLPKLSDVNPSISKAGLLLAIERERQIEYFAEWGHRWFDLKRTPALNLAGKTRADEILGTVKGDFWQTTDQLYPIPQTELNNDKNLNPQNPGY